jgi:hypothetical protein
MPPPAGLLPLEVSWSRVEELRARRGPSLLARPAQLCRGARGLARPPGPVRQLVLLAARLGGGVLLLGAAKGASGLAGMLAVLHSLAFVLLRVLFSGQGPLPV